MCRCLWNGRSNYSSRPCDYAFYDTRGCGSLNDRLAYRANESEEFGQICSRRVRHVQDVLVSHSELAGEKKRSGSRKVNPVNRGNKLPCLVIDWISETTKHLALFKSKDESSTWVSSRIGQASRLSYGA